MKKRHYKRGFTIFTIAILVCAVTALGYFAHGENARAEAYRRYAEAGYQGAFNELVTSVNEINSALEKSIYCTSPSITSEICTQIFGRAMAAQMSLGVLPCSTTELEQTAGFISRIGDYAFSLSRASSGRDGYSDEERVNLKKLSETARLLSQNLSSLQADMNAGGLTMDDLYAAERKLDEAEGEQGEGPATAGGAFRLIEQEFPEMPTLIYDGPFSEHIAAESPRILEGAEELSENAARRKAANFLRVQEGMVFVSGKMEGVLPAFRFTAKLKSGEVHVTMTRRGGEIISMMNERLPESTDITPDEAKEKATAFLEDHGYENMTASYYITSDNACTINYAYTQDGVVCYPDLIKVKVALDDGSILGFEAAGYVAHHGERELPEIAVDTEAAKQRLAGDLQLLEEGMALIPSAGEHELLCHEFKCETEGGEHLIVYVNAVTGDQEKILILIEDENGTLCI